MMAMMLRTMTMMCFLHADIPRVTIGSTTALMLFCPSVPHVLGFYLFQELVWLDVLS